MSRSSHLRQMQLQQQQQMADNEAAALAAEMFDHFCVATTMRQILGLYRNMCDTVGLRPGPLNEFYPKLKAKIRSWKAQALWKKFDTRAAHRVYNKGNACTGTRVLVIGAGPCGLRTAIEAQLLGAKVVVVEKRDRISRNNVLHLWPFVITDLRNLGAKKFYGKFCAGSIDHISIRQLQCILLKVALLLGVEIHEGVSFVNTIEPSDGCGWRAQVSPEDHAVSHYEFDVLIGADGKRNTLESFKRKEFRGKLAIAITANFINKKTEAEAKAEEISGVAFIFNQSFFKELYATTGIDLENIVYYKDETHYFVMTAKKHSLIDKGVIIQDFADPAELLAPGNVNTDKLLDYAREAAEFSTKYQMPNLEFAVNHYGKPDVAMFDFTSMFAAEASCRVIVRKNYRLLQCLVGDSLLEPFWPTGSGCARGFLSSMDAAYAIKLWANQKNSILGVLAQRESIYRLLAQTTPENLHRDIGAYTVDPATRYPNLNKATVNVWQVKHLVDTDDKSILEQVFMDTNAIQATTPETPIRRKRRTGDTLPISTVLLRWIKAQLHGHEFSHSLNEVSECFTGGKVLCALINRYRPDLVDLNEIKDLSPIECNELAFKILENDLSIPRVMSAKDSINLENVDSKIWLNYLEQICEVFRGEIPHVKHPKLDFAELKEKGSSNTPDFSRLLKMSSRKAKSPMQDIDVANVIHRRSGLDEEKLKRQRKYGIENTPVASSDTSRRARKRRSQEKSTNIEERQQRLKEIEANRLERQSKRRLQRFQQTQNFYKSLHMLQANTFLRESDSSSPFEDYSIYLYRQQAPEFNDRVKELERKLLYPDRERGIQSAMPRGLDENFSDRIKSMEQRITSRGNVAADKKPKDLLRAIGKIESTDWNIREIEKKIEQSKKTEIGKSREKVPKWTKEQFLARQNKMAKPDRQESTEEKFKEIDQTLKNLDKQLKEGSILEVGERGRNKVASIAGQFVKKEDAPEEKIPPVPKSSSKVGLVFNKQAASEKCHFCKQTVYLMEKISTEGLILHRSCLKCHHCHTNLRLGAYAFDRDDPVGRFYCTQHFRLPAKAVRPVVRKPSKKRSIDQGRPANEDQKTPIRTKGRPENVAQLDMLDRGQTPERIEFENADAMSDGEPSLENIIDENEWTDRNFISGSDDLESDISSSDSSDDDSDSDLFEEANGSPIGAQTLQLATDWIGKQRYSNMDDDSDADFYDSSEGLLDSDSQTDRESFRRARAARRREYYLPWPIITPQTDTETEVVSKEDIQQINNDKISSDNICDNTFTNESEDKNNNQIERCLDLVGDKSQNIEDRDGPSKTDIKIIERNLGRKVSTDIDALNENIYNLNNLIKLNKDVDNIKKDHLVKDDIMKKLSLKEKWLNDLEVTGSLHKIKPEKVEIDEMAENVMKVDLGKEDGGVKLSDDVNNENVDSATKFDVDEKVMNDKSIKEKDFNEIESKKDDLGKTESKIGKSQNTEDEKDIGKFLYDLENKFSPKGERKMSNTLKKIEVKNFSDTMDSIKSQISSPKISKQSSFDLSKYFPNQKSEKAAPVVKNKNQKTLKDVDLSQYFPQSPVNQRKGSLTPSVASKQSPALRRKSEALGIRTNSLEILKKTPSSVSNNKSAVENVAKSQPNILHQPVLKKNTLSKQESIEEKRSANTSLKNSLTNFKGSKESELDIFDQLLDGAVDIKNVELNTAEKNSPKTEKKTKKIVTKKSGQNSSPKAKQKKKNTTKDKEIQNVLDVNEQIFEEILQDNQNERSPSLEYKRLFNEEKSPSEDISEKIEKILKEPDTNLSNLKISLKRKKLMKTSKSLGDENHVVKSNNKKFKEDGDKPDQVLNVTESRKSASPSKKNKSSKLNEEKRNSMDFMSDFEKTMEYLKSEWKSEATNFLQSKRESFYAKRKGSQESKENSFDITDQTDNVNLVLDVSNEVRPESKEVKNDENMVLVDSVVDEILQDIIDEMEHQQSDTKGDKSDEDKSAEFVENELSADGKEITASSTDLESDKTIDENIELLEGQGEIKETKIKIEEKCTEEDQNTLELGLHAKETNINIEVDKVVQGIVETGEFLRNNGELTENTSKNVIKLAECIEVSNNKVQGIGQDVLEKTEEISPKNEIATVRTMDKSSNSNDEVELKSEQDKQSVSSDKNYDNCERDSGKDDDKSDALFSDLDVDNIDVDEVLNEMMNEFGTTEEQEEKNESVIRTTNSTEPYETISKDDIDSVKVSTSPMVDNKSKEISAELQTSKSPSVEHDNVKREGSSSEEDSIEKLFSQFTEDMLVDVEFDSNDEIVSITPRGYMNKEEDNNKSENVLIEKKEIFVENDLKSKVESDKNILDICQNKPQSNPEEHFPLKPVRRNKSTSSSKSPSIPNLSCPKQNQTDLSRLNPTDMPPSVQDILRNIREDEKVYFVEINDAKKFPITEQEECLELSSTKKSENSSPVSKTEEKISVDKETIDEWKYIEELEKERRVALIKRDELYAKQNKPITLISSNTDDKRKISVEKENSYKSGKGINESIKAISRSDNNIASSPPKVPPRSPKAKRKLYQEKDNLTKCLTPEKTIIQTENDKKEFLSTTMGLSKSSEHIPQRPQRRKTSITSEKDPIDDGTKLLLERSKMLHSLKQDFMNEKIVGNNPYLKKMIKNESDDNIRTPSNNEVEDKDKVYSHFPTSKSIETRKHQRNNSDYSDTGRRTPNLVSSLGPRNFVEYFKRSPSKSKERETSKESCVLS